MKPTLNELRDLPPTVDLMTAARILGIGRTKAYELARRGEFPCRIIRVGDLYRVLIADLLRLLGIDLFRLHGVNTGHDARPKAA